MKKRSGRLAGAYLAAVLAASAVLSSGCGKVPSGGVLGETCNLYYLSKGENLIVSAEYLLESQDMDSQIMELIAMQSRTPADESQENLLDEGVNIQGFTLEESVLTLDLDEAFTGMSPARRGLAIGGLVRTFLQLPGVEEVQFTIEGEPALDSYGNAYGPLTAENFVENSGETINNYQSTIMTLYFTDETGSVLIPEVRRVYYISSEPAEKAVVEAVIHGPEVSGHYPVLSGDTGVLSVVSQDGICYVNFDDTVNSTILSVREEIPLYAIVNSLTDSCQVSKVQFTINGESKVIYRENMDLSIQYQRNDALIQ